MHSMSVSRCVSALVRFMLVGHSGWRRGNGTRRGDRQTDRNQPHTSGREEGKREVGGDGMGVYVCVLCVCVLMCVLCCCVSVCGCCPFGGLGSDSSSRDCGDPPLTVSSAERELTRGDNKQQGTMRKRDEAKTKRKAETTVNRGQTGKHKHTIRSRPSANTNRDRAHLSCQTLLPPLLTPALLRRSALVNASPYLLKYDLTDGNKERER